jgi:adenosylcobinamide-phosphate synthase
MWRIDPLSFLAALGMDLLLGDPHHWPHLARMSGWLSTRFEGLCANILGRTVFSGAVFWFAVCGVMLGAYGLLHAVLNRWFPPGAWILNVAVIYQTVAARDLDRHARAVLRPLLLANLPEARAQLSRIVGRDTAHLDAVEVSRATVETVAESTTDGVIAPLFWAALGGPAAALLYRTANTLDSMVGHRDERYEQFGKWSAHADDVLSFVPARLCAFFSLLTRGFGNVAPVVREAGAHASPNAGWSESAAAWHLNVRLGGTNTYDGVVHHGPVFNAHGNPPSPRDILRCLRWFWTVTACASIACVLFLEWFRIRQRPEAPPLFPNFNQPYDTSR